MTGRYVTVEATDGGSFKAYLAAPETRSGPGIVLLAESLGIDADARDITDRYAEEGYAVLAPHLLWRVEPRIDTGSADEDRKQALAYRESFDALGFSLGGRLACLSAARLGVDCAVSY